MNLVHVGLHKIGKIPQKIKVGETSLIDSQFKIWMEKKFEEKKILF